MKYRNQMLLAVGALLFAQSASATLLNFTRLPDPAISPSVTVLSDGIQATASSPTGVAVSFNQGIGVPAADGSRSDINGGDVLTIVFDQLVNVGQIGMRLWGEASGGDSADISSSAGTISLVGPGDAGNGTVDLFTIDLLGITEFTITGTGSVGGFFVGLLDNVTLAGSTPEPEPNPDQDPDPEPNPPGPVTVPAPAVVWLFGIGLLGMVVVRRRQA